MEDSGGEKEEYEAAFCEDALQEASISESEMDMEMDETPKGDNPTVFTGAAEELDKGHTREPPPRIRNFNGMSLEDLFVIENMCWICQVIQSSSPMRVSYHGC